ncbi:glycine cleavage system protein GcvH [Azospirillum sp. SYSU D00513]|uniref:glycine cleavage system protein GcvH n=1 Tax=Azospirillum sp. SYSU D00513 TaxID=2812561 RepID=UPI001A96B092|nr:glycine cleavage system protein GcvH [Azospirillum sp. SYSU D00513]
MTVKFTKDHEWIRVEGDEATVGVSDYAQQQLGDVVFVELPDVGRTLEKGKEAAVVESVKAASEVFAPVSGEVIAVNPELEADPSLVNGGAESAGWFFKLRLTNPSELDGLMDEAAYKEFVEGQH